MDDRDYWTRKLREAERDLDIATKRSDVDAAAKRLQHAKQALKALEAEVAKRPKRRSGRASGSAGAS